MLMIVILLAGAAKLIEFFADASPARVQQIKPFKCRHVHQLLGETL
jgi:hypothetical protein